MPIKQLKATDLIWDTTLYPRQDVSSVHISELADALRMEQKLPAIVVDQDSKRIADGVNRWKAYQKVFGPDCLIPCDVRRFANEKDLFLFAVSSNTAHGLGLTPFEKTKCLLEGDKLGITREEMGIALRLPPERAERMTAKTAYRAIPGGNDSELIPLKGALQHLAGSVLTKKQIAANAYSGGMRPLYYVNQVALLLESGVCKDAGQELVAGLYRLQELLRVCLPKRRSEMAGD